MARSMKPALKPVDLHTVRDSYRFVLRPRYLRSLGPKRFCNALTADYSRYHNRGKSSAVQKILTSRCRGHELPWSDWQSGRDGHPA
jgi:hypothetical protein